MKKTFTIFISLITSVIFAQKFTTTPSFPNETSNIEITFDIEQMTNKSLVGYTGTLYTHTGVNTTKGDWQHVIGNWGNNSVQPSLTRISANKYKISINNPRAYYKLKDATEKITSLNFVLRSSNGNTKTEDLFVPIYATGINVKLLEPLTSPFFPLIGKSFSIVAVANNADNLKLYINNNLIKETNSDTIKTNYLAQTIGKNELRLVATNSSNTIEDTSYFYVRSAPTIAELPANVKTGINYIDDNTVTLALYAPKKDFVYTIGDFNNWELSDNYSLKLTPDSTTYWITLNNLVAAKEYRFQYLVDGKIRIADPYADKILEDEDKYISDKTYPNLISYPSDKTNFSVSVFQTAQTPYTWQATNYKKPKKENLIIYELLIRDFVKDHNYQTLIDTLDYLKKLGINAIELMPINEFEGNESWGYNPSFYFAPDKYYGTKNDLKKFIDECHKNNIAVIMDIVLNHSFGRSPFVRLYADGDYGPPTSENPWYNVTSPNAQYSWGFDFNHQSEQTKLLVDRINKYWIDEYKFDGFRFDFTKGFTNKPGDGWAYDASRVTILERMADAIWAIDPTAYVILEHLAENREEKILANYGMMLWGNMNHAYNEATMGYNTNGKSDLTGISYKNRNFNNPNLIGYMESHDEERLMFKNLQYGNSSGNYNIKQLSTALNRIKLAAAFFLTIPGPKMIWQFGELGYDISINFNGRVGNKPIRWDYLNDVNRKNLYKTFAALNFLKNNYAAFSTDNFQLDVRNNVKRIKLNHDSMNVSIIGNFDVVSKQVSPEFQHGGMWYDYFSGDSINVTDTQVSFTLEPGKFNIYTSKKLPTPEANILLNVKLQNEVIPEQYSISQNYPNPFNPSTTISFSIPNVVSNINLSKVSLKVYDILGKEVAVLVDKKLAPGNYNITFDANTLPSGVYFYTFSTKDFHQTKKMILLK